MPRSAHDRVIAVQLMPDELLVHYHLEIDEWTVVFKDLPALFEPAELAKFKSPREFYDAFAKSYGPILAGNLSAKLDGQELTFTCVKHSQQVTDSVQCDFVFRAVWQLSPARPHRLEFRETNYHLEVGRIDLTLSSHSFVSIKETEAPAEALRKKPLVDLRPGDDAKLRSLRVSFTAPELLPLPREQGGFVAELLPPPREDRVPSSAAHPGSQRLLHLFLETQHGFLMLLLLSAWLGAAHALQPGHGKTMVAAYLVGTQGTAWHAVVLGVVTTLTHTGAVLILAVVLLLFPQTSVAAVNTLLGFVGGLLVAGLGFWLLLRRLTGQADHVHFGGGHHHHHHHEHPHDHHDHGSTDHYHDEHGKAHAAMPLGWWGMIILGVRGGMIPCWDAIALFGLAVGTPQRGWLALPMLLAFSAGLAAVLVAVGIVVVRVQGFAGSRWGESRLFRALPVLTALILTGLGLWLCYDSLHGRPPD